MCLYAYTRMHTSAYAYMFKRTHTHTTYMRRKCVYIYTYGRFAGGGGGVIPTQSRSFFSSRLFCQKYRSGGRGMLQLFEFSKKRPFRKGMGNGGVR